MDFIFQVVVIISLFLNLVCASAFSPWLTARKIPTDHDKSWRDLLHPFWPKTVFVAPEWTTPSPPRRRLLSTIPNAKTDWPPLALLLQFPTRFSRLVKWTVFQMPWIHLQSWLAQVIDRNNPRLFNELPLLLVWFFPKAKTSISGVVSHFGFCLPVKEENFWILIISKSCR